MIVPQLSRCRQCKAYLHGTGVEGFIFDQLLPAQVQRSPGTATLCLLVCLFYALMISLAGPSSVLGFSSYTLQQLGATHGPSIMLGEYWRFVTSIFGHHDLLHLALNLWSLVFVGDLVERIFDRKKMMLIYFYSGFGSMMVSHIWYTTIIDRAGVVSAGASGAVCGLIGAALVSAKRSREGGPELQRSMLRWTVLMVVWGFAVPGINNAAHFGGFAIGAALAYLTPVGVTKKVITQKLLSVAMLATLGLVAFCTALMIKNMRGYPVSLDNDRWARSILGQVYYEGHDPQYSDQVLQKQACEDAIEGASLAVDEAIHRCELNMRINPHERASYEMLALLYDKKGDREHAQELRRVGGRVAAR
jgi:membrane associated rhomboid family serine protease